MQPVQILCVAQSELWALLHPPGNHSRVSRCQVPHVTHKTLRLTKGEGVQRKWGRVRKGIALFHF